MAPELVELNEKIAAKVANIDKEIEEIITAKRKDKLR